MDVNEKAIQMNENFKDHIDKENEEKLLACGGMKKCPKCGYLMFQLFIKCAKCGADVRSEQQKDIGDQSQGGE